MHLKFHTGQAMRCPFAETDGCTYMAVRKQNMEEHIIKHTQEKRALCEVCGAKFRSEKVPSAPYSLVSTFLLFRFVFFPYTQSESELN